MRMSTQPPPPPANAVQSPPPDHRSLALSLSRQELVGQSFFISCQPPSPPELIRSGRWPLSPAVASALAAPHAPGQPRPRLTPDRPTDCVSVSHAKTSFACAVSPPPVDNIYQITVHIRRRWRTARAWSVSVVSKWSVCHSLTTRNVVCS